MYAHDRKPEEAQRKAATTRRPVPPATTVAAGTHSPDALQALQRSAGNAAVARAIEQERNAASSGPVVQRWPKGPHMQGYDRAGISNATTEEMLSYQGVAAERPASPRARQRLDELEGENQYDRALATNWQQNQRTGTTHGASPVPISRNHRLSDHYVGHIIERAAETRRTAGNDGMRVLQIDTAVRQLITACAPSASVDGIMDGFRQFAGANSGFEEIVGATSNNGRNLRAGHSRDNSTIKEHFDPGIIVGGEATPITKSIMEAVNNLASAKVIPKELAEEALQPYRGWTSSDVRTRA